MCAAVGGAGGDAGACSVNEIHAQLCRHLARTSEVRIVSDQFNALKTNDERVFFCHKLLGENHYLPHLIENGKSEQKAIDLKQQGNALFEARKYYEALKKYNQSIAYADFNKPQVLPQVYTNRATLFLHCRMPKECLKDIEYISKCIISPQLAKKLSEMEKKASKIKQKPSENINAYHDTAPQLKNPNKKFECAENSIEMGRSEILGRHLLAKQRIETGEVIAIERPYKAVLLPEFRNTHCSECLKAAYCLLPCSFCPHHMFCSQQCAETSINEKRYECPIYSTLLRLRVGKLQLLALKVVVAARNYFEKPPRDDVSEIYKSARYSEIHHLASNQDKRATSDLFERSTTAAVLYHLLLEHTPLFVEFPEEKQEQVRRFIAGNLLHHLQTAPTNMHEIAELSGSASSENGKYLPVEVSAQPFHSVGTHMFILVEVVTREYY